MKHTLLLFTLLANLATANDVYKTDNTAVPNLQMQDNNLSFNVIEGYQNYKIIATHFRTDKNELRYILANPIAYNAIHTSKTTMPQGSKIVKIGWSVKKMEHYPAALEADKIQRVEYMVKDSKQFNHNGDHWGYARFIKKEGKYTAWDKGVQSCINCHASEKESDFLFTKRQLVF